MLDAIRPPVTLPSRVKKLKSSYMQYKSSLPALVAALLLASSAAHAALINLGPGSFTPLAPVITFSEQAVGTVNPVYTGINAGSLGLVDITFAASFVGQTITGTTVRTLTGSPTGPLTLNNGAGSGITRIVEDGAAPTSPVLSGDPIFNGPVSVLFSVPVAAVGLSAGFFNAVGGTSITAYDVNGAVLGSIVNSELGIEFYGLADSTGANVIKGISFYITGNEPAGFAIDNLTFGSREVLVNNAPDAGSSSLLMLLSILGCVAFRRRRTAA